MGKTHDGGASPTALHRAVDLKGSPAGVLSQEFLCPQHVLVPGGLRDLGVEAGAVVYPAGMRKDGQGTDPPMMIDAFR